MTSTDTEHNRFRADDERTEAPRLVETSIDF